MATKIQLRRDTSTNWTANDPVLADGEIGFETNTGLFKIGKSNTAWTDLDYAQLAGPTGAIGETGPKGDPGEAGAPGADGADGVDGIDGVDGLNGIDGVDGTFATAQTISSDITTSTYTISTSDAGKLLIFNRSVTLSSPIIITVPLNSSDPIPVGTRIDILQRGTAQLLLYPDGGGGGSSVYIYSSSGLYTRDRYSGATLVKISTDEWSLVGDLTDTAI